MQKYSLSLFLALYLLSSVVTAQSASFSMTGTVSVTDTVTVTVSGTNTVTGTVSNTVTGTVSNTVTNTVSNTVTNTVSNTVTNSNSVSGTVTVSNTITNSITLSGSMSVTGAPVFTPVLFVRPPAPGELNCFTVYFQQPSPDYPNYQFTVIPPPSMTTMNVTVTLVVPTSQLLFIAPYYYYTICRSNVSGINLFTLYSVQVAGYFTPSVRSQPSYPVFVSIGSAIVYTGPAISPDGTNSVNGLTCQYTPPYINCTFSLGARSFNYAILSFNCTRTVVQPTTAFKAKARLQQRLQAATPMPTTASSFLPTGCMCTGKLQAFYANAPTSVELYITLPSSSITTNIPPIVNTPTMDIIA